MSRIKRARKKAGQIFDVLKWLIRGRWRAVKERIDDWWESLVAESHASRVLSDLPSDDPRDYVEAMEYQSKHRDLERVEVWRYVVLTRRLERTAKALGLDLPVVTDESFYKQVEWDDDPTMPYYLTQEGFKLVRSRISDERRRQREAAVFWIGAASGLGGLMVAVISLLKS